jgi:hypothetical protein
MSQRFTWSQISITENAFRAIASDIRVFTPFVDIVRAFGRKVEDGQRARHTVHSHIPRKNGRTSNASCFGNITSHHIVIKQRTEVPSEFCYILHYMELNGRRKGHPWSLRQTAVYQRLDLSEERSIWILLQHSPYIHRCLTSYLENEDRSSVACKDAALHLHFVFLFAGTRNWHAYIQHVESLLRRYVSNA